MEECSPVFEHMGQVLRNNEDVTGMGAGLQASVEHHSGIYIWLHAESDVVEPGGFWLVGECTPGSRRGS